MTAYRLIKPGSLTWTLAGAAELRCGTRLMREAAKRPLKYISAKMAMMLRI
jgi:hypothetical protein